MVAIRVSVNGLYESAIGRGGKLVIFEDRFSAEDCLNDFDCQSASEVGGLFMTVMKVLGANFERFPEIRESKICVAIFCDAPFAFGQMEAFSDIPRGQFSNQG